MSADILIHKNSYTKMHSGLTHACMKYFADVKLFNCHNQIYDLFFAIKPKHILLQLEEYTQEIHTFIHDASVPSDTSIFISIDDAACHNDKYLSVLQQIRTPRVKFILPELLADIVRQNTNLDQNQLIPYANVVNTDIFFQIPQTKRNNKILCILDMDKQKFDIIKPYLYPNTNKPIIMINNPELSYDQNVGLAFDADMNIILNTFGAVIDLSGSYAAEISVCATPVLDHHKDNWINSEPLNLKIDYMTTDDLLKQIFGVK